MCMSMVWRYTKLSQGIHLCHLPSHFQRSTVYCPSHSTQSSRAWTSSSFHLSKKEIQIHVNIRFFIKHFLKLIVMKKCEKTLILTEVCVCVCLCVYMCVCACKCVCVCRVSNDAVNRLLVDIYLFWGPIIQTVPSQFLSNYLCCILYFEVCYWRTSYKHTKSNTVSLMTFMSRFFSLILIKWSRFYCHCLLSAIILNQLQCVVNTTPEKGSGSREKNQNTVQRKTNKQQQQQKTAALCGKIPPPPPLCVPSGTVSHHVCPLCCTWFDY